MPRHCVINANVISRLRRKKLENLQSSAVLPLEHRGSVIDARPRFKARSRTRVFEIARRRYVMRIKAAGQKLPLGSCLSKETHAGNE